MVNGVKVVPATSEDVDVIVHVGLRTADVAELRPLGQEPEQALRTGLLLGDMLTFTVLVDGVPAAMFGATPTDEPGVGAVWMLGTDLLDTTLRALLREAPLWLDMLNAVYPILTNFVSDENEATIKWLTRMGFDFPFVDDFVTDEGITYRRFLRCVPQPSQP